MTDLQKIIDTHLHADGESSPAGPDELLQQAWAEEDRLRWVLKADAAVTALNGLAYLAGATLLDSLLGLPTMLLRAVGGILVVYAGMVLLVATRRVVPSVAVWALITLNALWALDSVLLVAAGWFSPAGVGNVWIVLQAITVAAFAVLQRSALAGSNGTEPRKVALSAAPR